MNKELIILIGAPAAGKSTWVQKQFQCECHVLSTDNIIEELADAMGKTYDEIFSDYIKVAEKMFWEDFDRHVSEGYSPIFIDRTNMSIKSRARIFNRLQQWHRRHGYTVSAVVFSTPDPVEHERRLVSRPGKTIPKDVVESMIESYEMPIYKEGFNNICLAEPTALSFHTHLFKD